MASWGKIFKLAVVSGAHIGFGAYLAITVGGACPGIAAENPGLQKVSRRSSSEHGIL
jgi:formate transporter